MATKKTKRKVKRFIPSFVITDGKTSFIYQMQNVKPMTKKTVETLDKRIQELIASGKITTSLAYIEVQVMDWEIKVACWMGLFVILGITLSILTGP